MPRSGSRPRTLGRHVFLLALVGVLFAVVAARLVWVQGVEASAYAKLAEKQRMRDIVLPPRRGAILDREGERLAVTSDARTIYAVPRTVKDPAAAAQALSAALGGDPATYLEKLSRKTGFVYIARKVDVDRATAVERLGLTGIYLLDDARRTYPSGELACQVLGFVGVDDKGLAGIEQEYDDVLAGVPGRLIGERDRLGDPIPGGVVERVDPVQGRDITLTIDKDIQYQAHLALASAVQRFAAKGGSVIVMDPRSGEIYAMASTPYFNPNDFASADPKAFLNRALTDAYEPGSTVKAVTAAAVIEEKLYGPESMFNLPSTLKVGDRTIHESHDRGTVDWSLSQIVTKSSNVGAVKLGIALGKTRLYRYFELFGLTERTGVDFPGEARGAMPPPSSWSQSSIGNLPFGQGMSVSALQLARSLTALANDGVLVTPHFLLGASGDTSSAAWPTRRVVSAATARTMTAVLADVVIDGTGAEAAVSGYEVAGKTGTAQIAGRGGYREGAYVSSFAGYLPAGDPRVLIVVTIDEPGKAYYGGTVAAPTFATLGRFCVEHLKIPPAQSVRPAPAAAVPAPVKSTAAKSVAGSGNGKVSKGTTTSGDPEPVLESTDPER